MHIQRSLFLYFRIARRILRNRHFCVSSHQLLSIAVVIWIIKIIYFSSSKKSSYPESSWHQGGTWFPGHSNQTALIDTRGALSGPFSPARTSNVSKGQRTLEENIAHDYCAMHPSLIEDYSTSLVDWNCAKEPYHVRRLCSFQRRGTPPLLWSFPGSGNTWVRQLIERGSGLATGSVYNDLSLAGTLPGEGKCSKAFICLKAHPTTHPFSLVTNHAAAMFGESPPLEFQLFRNSVIKNPGDSFVRWKAFGMACRSTQSSRNAQYGSEPLNFIKALIVDRHPLDAAFSELQRRIGLRSKLPLDNAHTYRFPSTIEKTITPRAWEKFCDDYLRLGADYVLSWKSYVQFAQRFGNEAVHIVRYEDLLDQKKQDETINSILLFLGSTLLTDPACLFSSNSTLSMNRQRPRHTAQHHRDNLTLGEFLQTIHKGRPILQWMWNIVAPVAEIRGYNLLPGVHVPADYRSSLRSHSLDEGKPAQSSALWYEDPNLSVTFKNLRNAKRTQQTAPQSTNFPPISMELAECVESGMKAQLDKRVVLLFAGDAGHSDIGRPRNYFIRILNALVWLNRANVDEVLTATFDWSLHAMLRSRSMHTCFIELEPNKETGHIAKSEIFLKRLQIVEVLLRAGLNVIHSDTDAIWTQNPIPFIGDRHSSIGDGADIVASTGTFPHKERKLWGGPTLCMGFISFLSNSRVIQVVRIARSEAIVQAGDDQIGINRALRRLGVTWNRTKSHVGTVQLQQWPASAALRVTLVSDLIVLRNCSVPGRKALVMHCFDRDAKQDDSLRYKKRMQRHGLWTIREDWRRVLDTSTAIGRLWLDEFSI